MPRENPLAAAAGGGYITSGYRGQLRLCPDCDPGAARMNTNAVSGLNGCFP